MKFFKKPDLPPYQADINRRKNAYSVPKSIGTGAGGFGRRPEPIVSSTTTNTTTVAASTTTTTTTNPYITASKAGIVVYGYGTVWSYVIGNDTGGLTSELQFTGIDTSTWNLRDVYPVESKGWGVVFDDGGSNYKFVSLKSSGHVIDVTTTDNYNDYDTLEDKGFFYSYSVGADEYYKFFNGLTVSTNVITNSNYDGYGSNYDDTSKNGGFIVSVYSNGDSSYHRYYLKGASASDMGQTNQNQIFTFVNGSFIFKIVDDGTYYTTVYIYDESMNLKQTIDISSELYRWYDLNSYGIDKAMIYFYGPDNASYEYLFTYDGATNTLLSKQLDSSISHNFYYTNSYPGYTYDHFSETLGIYLYPNWNGSGDFDWFDGTASFIFIEDGASSIGDPVELPPANSWDFETIGSLWTLPTGTGSSYASPNYHDLKSVNLSLISHTGIIYGATISGFTAANDTNVNSYGLRNRSVSYYYRDGVADFCTVDSNGAVTISSITSSSISINYNGNSLVVRDYDNSTSYYLGSTNSLVNLNTNYGTVYWPEDNMAPNYESPSYMFLFNYNTTYDGVMINNNQASWTADFSYLSGMSYNLDYNPYFMTTTYIDAGTLHMKKYNTSNGALTDTITLNNASSYNVRMIYKMSVVEVQHTGGTYTYYYLTQNTSKSIGIESMHDFSFNDWSWWW